MRLFRARRVLAGRRRLADVRTSLRIEDAGLRAGPGLAARRVARAGAPVVAAIRRRPCARASRSASYPRRGCAAGDVPLPGACCRPAPQPSPHSPMPGDVDGAFDVDVPGVGRTRCRAARGHRDRTRLAAQRGQRDFARLRLRGRDRNLLRQARRFLTTHLWRDANALDFDALRIDRLAVAPARAKSPAWVAAVAAPSTRAARLPPRAGAVAATRTSYRACGTSVTCKGCGAGGTSTTGSGSGCACGGGCAATGSSGCGAGSSGCGGGGGCVGACDGVGVAAGGEGAAAVCAGSGCGPSRRTTARFFRRARADEFGLHDLVALARRLRRRHEHSTRATTAEIAKHRCNTALKDAANHRNPRSSRIGGCHCWRHNVREGLPTVELRRRACGGDASGRCASSSTKVCGSAPFTACGLAGIESNHACQPGGNVPGGFRPNRFQPAPQPEGFDEVGGGEHASPAGRQAASRGMIRRRARRMVGRVAHRGHARHLASSASSRCPASASRPPCRSRGNRRRTAARTTPSAVTSCTDTCPRCCASCGLTSCSTTQRTRSTSDAVSAGASPLIFGARICSCAAGGLLHVVDLGAIEERHAGRIQPQREAFAIDRPFVAAAGRPVRRTPGARRRAACRHGRRTGARRGPGGPRVRSGVRKCACADSEIWIMRAILATPEAAAVVRQSTMRPRPMCSGSARNSQE